MPTRHTFPAPPAPPASPPPRAKPPPAAAVGGAPGALAARLIAWQRSHGRHDLPWQATRDPYRVWLSEIMLQQTQVATVIAYYARFIESWPDVASLAAASLDEVLALWSGLGYYSRARNLHRCAQLIMAEHGGRFPPSAAQLAQLPGIGRSTAAAIAAFCFGERAAILDGNVKRVLTRALGFHADLASSANERALWQRAEALLPREEQAGDGATSSAIADYTQGLMDLGASLCSTRRPRCDACPLQPICVAARTGDAERYPVKTRRTRRGERSNALLLLWHAGRIRLGQRPPRGVWAGLWVPPLFDDAEALARDIAGWPGAAQPMPPLRHALTHFEWHLAPWRLELPPDADVALLREIDERLPGGRWFEADEALRLALPAPVRKLVEAA